MKEQGRHSKKAAALAAREKRLAEALRANLKRRKQAVRTESALPAPGEKVRRGRP